MTIANVSANCTLAVVATGDSTGGGGGNEGDSGTIDLTTISMQLYNKAISGNADAARLSTTTNPYLQAGWKVTVNSGYTMAGAQTTDANSVDKLNGSWDLTSNGFKGGTWTVANTGYYMMVFTKSDNTEAFDLSTDPNTLAGYISISKS